MGKKNNKEVEVLINKLKIFKRKMKFDKLILFGSYGRGDFNKDSDVDLILVDKKFEEKNYFERSKGLWIKWHSEFKMGYPVDFLCYTPEEFKKLKKGITIVREAVENEIEV